MKSDAREEKPQFLEMALGIKPLPKGYGVTTLSVKTREYLRARAVKAGDFTTPNKDLVRIPSSYIEAPFHGAREAGTNSPLARQVLQTRLRVLELLCTANVKSEARRARAFSLARDELKFFVQIDHAVAMGGLHQFGQEHAWWKPGALAENEQHVEDLLARAGASNALLKRNGFIQISGTEYARRIWKEAAQDTLTFQKPDELTYLAAIIALYTASRSERGDMEKLLERLRQDLVRALLTEMHAYTIKVPMAPLYSLPREARALSMFFISREKAKESLLIDQDNQNIRPVDHPNMIAKVTRRKQDEQLSLLFTQRELAKRKGNENLIQLELTPHPGPRGDHETVDVLAELIRGIEQLDVDEATLEHVPRVCAGMFSAAQHDRRLSFNWPGTFWDTNSGRRLCGIIGFDPDNKRHRIRVQNVRDLLEEIILHRDIYKTSVHGVRQKARWVGPIIEKRAAMITLEEEHREGFSQHNTFCSWSIAKELWDMVIPEEEGGTPSFMKIDERAFLLDEKSSVPFNLYWTLINRAYMGSYTNSPPDQVNERGVFSPKIGTLCKWSGLEGRFVRPDRLKKKFREAFDKMKAQGLLTYWKCEALDDDSSLTYEKLLDERIEVGLCKEQLDSLVGSSSPKLLEDPSN